MLKKIKYIAIIVNRILHHQIACNCTSNDNLFILIHSYEMHNIRILKYSVV